MKRSLTIVLVALAMQVFAQNNPITSINISLPANPDANVANWGTGTTQLVITATSKGINGRVDPRLEEGKLLVIIKKGGSKICGAYTSSTAPSANFNTLTKVWTGANAASAIGTGCTLPPGDYELSVQFFGRGPAGSVPLSDEKTKAFTITGNEQQVYQAAQLIAPANGTELREADIPKPITFRWTPLIPRPQDPVTYRLRVWQLMQGQNGTQARSVNQPIFTKDVDNITQAIVTGILTGPCKPPYLCDFAWNVQSLNREGKPVGGNNGTSELFTIKFKTPDETTGVTRLILPANNGIITAGQQTRFTWLPPTPTIPREGASYKIRIVEIKGDQSPEQAIHTNKPIFEKDSLKELSVSYPSSAPAFKSGQKYAWNVQAFNRDGKDLGTSPSTTFMVNLYYDILPEGRVSPVSDTKRTDGNNNGAASGEHFPRNFKWAPVNAQGPVRYKLKIVEIKGDQSPGQAMRTNKPIFEKDSINGLSVHYPSPSPAFKSGQKYAWNVQAFNRDGKDLGTSPSTTFMVNLYYDILPEGRMSTVSDGKK
jgi:hypothetical protein